MQNPQVHEADLALEQNLGHGTTLAITYMASFGRELPTAIDTNLNLNNTANATFTVGASNAAAPPASYPISASGEPSGIGSSYSAYPQPAQNGSYVTLPHGGANLPLNQGQTYTTKVFLAGSGGANTRLNPAFYQILDVKSSVNSSYNALAAQLNHRYSHGLSIMANYTWSHAMDGNPYESTVVPSYTALDPTNPRADVGNSNTNVPNRFVLAGVYQPQTNFRGFKDYLLGGWRISPLFQAQNGLPYTPYVSGHPADVTVADGVAGCTTAAGCSEPLAYTSLNGSGSSADRLPWIERNTYKQPSTFVFDMRLGKNFYFNADRFKLGRLRFEVFAELFNVMNHQNITGVSSDAYSLSTSSTTLTPYTTPQFGSFTNANSNYTYSPRQLQLAARLHF